MQALVIGRLDLKIALGMLADRADAGCLGADMLPATEAADPHRLAIVLFEYLLILDVLAQLLIALLMFRLDLSHQLKMGGDFVETFLPGHLGKLFIHLGPLVVFPFGGILQIGLGIRHLAALDVFIPLVGVGVFIVGGLFKDGADLLIAVFFSLFGIHLIFTPGLGFAGKSRQQVCIGFAVFKLHIITYPFLLRACKDAIFCGKIDGFSYTGYNCQGKSFYTGSPGDQKKKEKESIMHQNTTRRLTYAALMLALGILIPMVFHTFQISGGIFLPMHLPILLCGFLCGPQFGALCGLVVPLVSSLFTGMPPMYPTAVAMALELLTYGLVTGLLRKKCNVYVTLLVAMLAGRAVSGCANLVLMGLAGNSYTLSAFLTASFVTALPGIVIQIVVIPLVIIVMKKAGLTDLNE